MITSKRYFQKKEYEKEPIFDRVYVVTLFTFYWKITVDTINFAKKLVKEINYRYPETNAYYGYMTRGCIRKCSFCAVPTLEPQYCEYIPLKQRIDEIKSKFGEQRNLLLLDNNVLASPRFPEIIQEIIDCGFEKGAAYTEPNQYAIALRNLQSGLNDIAYINKLFCLNVDLLSRLKGEQEQQFFNLLDENKLLNTKTVTKENLLKVAGDILPLYTKYVRKLPRQRYVDFNQGVDARLFTEENAMLLGKINIRPLRIAFDNIKDIKYYENAIRLSAKAGIKDFSNYLLYNFNDKPIDLYQRLKINIELCEELDINIYSFPMKFHPITGEDRFNRDYLGRYWNRKYIRAIQAILNAIKGKVGRGKEFFYKAFGESEEQFFKILEMPETFILYRFFFEWLGEVKNYSVSTMSWWNCWQETFSLLTEQETADLLEIIHQNKFSLQTELYVDNTKFSKLLSFYTNFRDDVVTQGTELYILKQEYDKNPTRKLRRKKR
ncbi:hypothetical protein AGMMS49982_06340 [Bacteroidia bacterium]|nr:hypothetical protein AGMMS49982_06340 [Bacteroidia bacterium]